MQLTLPRALAPHRRGVVLLIHLTVTASSDALVHVCSRVHHVESESDLCPEWFLAAGLVGLTAGTSTPDDIIDRVERRIRDLAPERRQPAPDTGGSCT